MTVRKDFKLRISVADRLEIADKRTTTAGYLAVRAKIARDGVYEYTRGSIGLEGNPNEIVGVYRSHDWVFDADNLATFAHKPICIGHPNEQVNSANWKKLAVGQIGDKVWEAEDRKHVQVDMLIMDQAGIDAATSHSQELSAGYSCEIFAEDGVAPDGTPYVAKMGGKLIADHLALVPRGRCGSAARVGDDAWPTEITDTQVPPKKETTNVKTYTLDGLPVRFDDEAALEAAFTKLTAKIADGETALTKALADKATAEAAVASAATANVTAIEAKDAEVATLTATVATLTSELADARDPAKLRDAAAEYGKVAEKAKALGGTFTDADNTATIKRSAVNTKLGDVAKDWTDAQVDVSFATLTAGVVDAAPDAFRDAMTHRNVSDFADAAAKAKTAREAMIAGFNTRETAK